MESFSSEFAAYVTMDTNHLTKARGIHHMKYMATETTEYFKEQFRSPSLISLPDPHAICKFVQGERRWALGTYFISAFSYQEEDPCLLCTTIPHDLHPSSAPFGPALAPAFGENPAGNPGGANNAAPGGSKTEGSRVKNVR